MTKAQQLADTYKEHTEIKYQPTRPYDSGPIFDLVYDAADEACTAKEVNMDNQQVTTKFTFRDESVLLIQSYDGATTTVEAVINQ